MWDLQTAILCIVLGALFAILYLLRVLILLERRIARMDENLFRITAKILQEEHKIEYEIKHPEIIRYRSSDKSPRIATKSKKKK